MQRQLLGLYALTGLWEREDEYSVCAYCICLMLRCAHEKKVGTLMQEQVKHPYAYARVETEQSARGTEAVREQQRKVLPGTVQGNQVGEMSHLKESTTWKRKGK